MKKNKFLFLLVFITLFSLTFISAQWYNPLTWFGSDISIIGDSEKEVLISSGQECIDVMTKNSYSIYKNSKGQLIKKGLLTSGEELYANSNCLKVEDAKSLKDTWIIPTIIYGKDKDDPKDITILDYNWTSKTIQINDKIDEVSYFVKDGIEKEEEIIKDIKDKNIIDIDSEGFKEIHFGKESTIVSFNYTYLIEDTTIVEATPTTDYHTNGNLFLGVYISGAMATILEYNRSKLNLDGATIVSSNISLYLDNKGGIGADSINVSYARYLGNQSMATIRWANANFYGVNWTRYMMFQDVNLTSSDDSRVFFNTTTMTQANVDNTDYKFTYVFYSNLSLSQSGRITEYGLFTSSNGGTAANRPILNIEYTELVSVPSVGTSILTPSTDQANYSQYQWHKVEINVSCTDADCGNINVSLDPTATCDPASETCGGCDDITVASTSGWYYDVNGFAYGPGCRASGDYYYTHADGSCDTMGASGSNSGDCAWHMGAGFTYEFWCPSYDRLGSAVAHSDCGCLNFGSGCPADAGAIFDLDSEFFAGASAGGPKGLINTTAGATPFWTNKSSNPFTINLNASQSQVVTFWINATGDVDSEYGFFAYANLTSDLSNSNISTNWTGSIISYNDFISPEISFKDPTPDNGITTSNTDILINVSINEINITDISYDWNGTTYVVFNQSLWAMMNLNDWTRLNDTSLYETDFTNSGATFNDSECKYGECYTFGGDGDYINSQRKIGEQGNATISLWFYNLQGKSDSYKIATLFGKSSGGDSDDILVGLSLNNNLSMYLSEVGGTDYYSLGIYNYSWHHITFVYEKARSVKLYIDGELETNQTISQAWANDNIPFGDALYSNDEAFKGNMDEIMIWNRSLGDEEIRQRYKDNLYKFNNTGFNLEINQTKNFTAPLDNGNYTYQAFATDVDENLGSTEERSINIGATPEDTSFTVEISQGFLNITFFNNNKSVTKLQPMGQNSSDAIMKITNTGSVSLDIYMNTNETSGGFNPFVNGEYNSVTASPLNQTLNQIVDSLNSSSSQNIWLWVDWTDKNPQTVKRELNVSVQNN